MCQGFSDFTGFLHHFVLAKLATSSIRVKLPTAGLEGLTGKLEPAFLAMQL